MTDDELFKNAITLARQEFDKVDPITPRDIVIGALIRAVELLAGDQFRGATKVEPTSPGHFDDALVERLAKSGSPDWDVLPEYVQERRRRHARAILAELASVPCELPTSEPIERILNECDAPHRSTNLTKSRVLAEWIRNAVAPILAAKDALNESLTATNQAQAKRIRELEKRIAELTAPMVVDGKTPGQVNQAAFAHSVENHHESEGVPNWEIAANAVLRAFGNGAEALRRVERALMPVARDKHFDINTRNIQAAFHAEIANIEGVKA